MEGAPPTPVRRRSRTAKRPAAAPVRDAAEAMAHFTNLLLNPMNKTENVTENVTEIRESPNPPPAPRTPEKRKSSRGCSSPRKETTSLLAQGLAEDGDAKSHRRVTKRRRIRHTTEAATHFSNLASVNSLDKTEDTPLIKESMSTPLPPRTPHCQAPSSPVPEGSAEKDGDAESQRRGTKRKQRQQKRKPIRPKVIKDEVTKFPKPVTPKQTGEKRRNHIRNKRQHTDNSKGLHSLSKEPPEKNISLSSPADKPHEEMKVYVRRFKSAKRSLATDLECEAMDAPQSVITTSSMESQIQEEDIMSGTSKRPRSRVKLTGRLEVVVETSQVGLAYDLNQSLTQELEEYIRSPESAASPDKPSRRVCKRVTTARSNLKQLDQVKNMISLGDPGIHQSLDESQTTNDNLDCKVINKRTKRRNTFVQHLLEMYKETKTDNNQADGHNLEAQYPSSNYTLSDPQKKIPRGKPRASSPAETTTKKRSRLTSQARSKVLTVPIRESDAAEELTTENKRQRKKRVNRDSEESHSSKAVVPHVEPIDVEPIDKVMENTFVPYGPMVPVHEEKKKKPRAKVDLDPETLRIWEYLTGKEGTEEPDADKYQWWEEQRQLYRGHSVSFIARMHLIQGSKHFSQWNGSVVDSVVGAFLTQNVSDNLSSSAFMSLAARFPGRPRNKNEYPNSEMRSTPEEKEKESMSCSDDTINFQATMPSPEEAEKQFGVTSEVDLFETDSSESHDIHKKGGEVHHFHVNGHRQQLDQETIEHDRSSLETNYKGQSDTSSRSYNLQSSDPRLVQIKKAVDNTKESSSGLSIPDFEVTDSYGISAKSKIGVAGDQKLTIIQAIDSKTSISNLCPQLINCSEREVCVENYSDNRFPEDETDSSFSDNFSQLLDDSGKKYQKKDRPEAFQEGDVQDENMQPTCAFSSESLNPAKQVKCSSSEEVSSPQKIMPEMPLKSSREKKSKEVANKKTRTDWDSLRREAQCNSSERERRFDTSDLVDWEAVRTADVSEVAKALEDRGMHNKLAARIQDFLSRLVNDHGSADLQWLREVPPDQAKDFLMSIFGLGLKSAECIRLLTLEQQAFPVDTNVGRICVRLGWVPLQPLPESTQLHLLELYPMMVSIQKYLWPRLCNLDRLTLYELHYQMITFGKIFCTKRKPNCHACPMRGECRHFASEFASAKLLLEWRPDEKNTTRSLVPVSTEPNTENGSSLMCLPMSEEPATPECHEIVVGDIEDIGVTDEILIEQIWDGVKERNLDIHYDEISKAIISIPHGALPAPKLKNVIRLRTEHQVYELNDEHPLLERVDKRVHDDPLPYLLAIWTPGETAESTQSPETSCDSKDVGKLCDDNTCPDCNSRREEAAQVVRATLLIPCRTANRGGFPLNGTYFQINEVFADHASSCKPMFVPRKMLWDLPRRTVYFGSSIPSIFRGMSTQVIQACCLKGYVCVRGFDRENGRPMPLIERLHKRPKSKKVQKASAEQKR